MLVTASPAPSPDCGNPRKWWVTALSDDLVMYVSRASEAVFAARLRGPCGEFPAMIRLSLTTAGDEIGLSIEVIEDDALNDVLGDAGLEMIEVNGKLTAEEFALLLNNNIVGDPTVDNVKPGRH